MFEFAWPYCLALIPLVWILPRLLPPNTQSQAAVYTPFLSRVGAISEQQSFKADKNSRLTRVLAACIWISLCIGAAKPMWFGDAVEMPRNGRDLLLAVDLSDSMSIADMTLNKASVPRIDLVKSVIQDFVIQRQGDRLGLVLFGSQAYLQAPLSYDRNTLGILLDEAQIGFAGKMTAIGDAIGLSIKRLQHQPDTARVLILLTDGANTAGEMQPLKAAELAAQAKVKIYTIGIGATEMITPGLMGTSFGSRKINPSRDLDEGTLRGIAESTGGKYFRATNEAELRAIYQELDQIEKIEHQAESYRPQSNLSYIAILVAFALANILVLRQLWSERLALGGSQ